MLQLAVQILPLALTAALPAEFAAHLNKKDSYTLFILFSRTRFIKTCESRIQGVFADLKIYLQMCNRLTHHNGYFLVLSFGTEEAEKVHRFHVAKTVGDNTTFKRTSKPYSVNSNLKSHIARCFVHM